MTGTALLVIPVYDVVAVRMYNRMGAVEGYNYLRAVKDFGNLVTTCACASEHG